MSKFQSTEKQRRYSPQERYHRRKQLKERGLPVPEEFEKIDSFADVRMACIKWLRSRGLHN